MPIPIEAEILSRVEAFANELVAVVRTSMVDLVGQALGGEAIAPRGRRGAAKSFSGSARAKGEKRDPKVLDALVDKLAAFIAKNPGLRIEEIGKALGEPTKDLALPIRKLITARRISTKGERRATRYFPAGGGAPRAAKRGKPGPKRGRAKQAVRRKGPRRGRAAAKNAASAAAPAASPAT